MDVTTHVDRLLRDVAVAGEAGGEDARALATRLMAPLESSIRLMVLEVLSAAADEITRDLAPGSVEVRLRGGEPDFVVVPAPADEPSRPARGSVPPPATEDDGGATARINLRLPERLKTEVDEAATRERLSTNAWLVRLLAAAVADDAGRTNRHGGRVGESYTGWAR